MKAITAIPNGGSGVSTGRVSRHHRAHNDSTENAEIKMYLSKLKDLVPFMPKNRKLSKLEIIQNVIDYICDLQSELETHPAINTFNAEQVLNDNHDQLITTTTTTSLDNNDIDRNLIHNNNNNSNNNNYCSSSPLHNGRKPLVDRSSPNTILSDSEVHQQNLINNQQLIHSHTTDKSA